MTSQLQIEWLVRDRVVHHFLFNQVNPWWNARFIEDNYSCRKGKGTLYGVRRLDHHMRSVSQSYTRPAYVLKLDIQGYFMSLERKKSWRGLPPSKSLFCQPGQSNERL